MKPKKINTVPNGTIIIMVMWFEIFFTFLIGLFLLPRMEAIGVFFLTLICFVILLNYLSRKHWNFIEASEEGVSHHRESYNWEDVCITVKCHNGGKTADYYAFFDDHFLTDKEVDSKLIKRKGFYMILTSKRVTLLLSNYQKEIKFLNESPYRAHKNITTQIKLHNARFAK